MSLSYPDHEAGIPCGSWLCVQGATAPSLSLEGSESQTGSDTSPATTTKTTPSEKKGYTYGI